MAFDTVDHYILLKQFETSLIPYEFVKSYLNERTQFVNVNDTKKWKPLLNRIPSNNIVAFADDTVTTSKSPWDETIESINSYLD